VDVAHPEEGDGHALPARRAGRTPVETGHEETHYHEGEGRARPLGAEEGERDETTPHETGAAEDGHPGAGEHAREPANAEGAHPDDHDREDPGRSGHERPDEEGQEDGDAEYAAAELTHA